LCIIIILFLLILVPARDGGQAQEGCARGEAELRSAGLAEEEAFAAGGRGSEGLCRVEVVAPAEQAGFV
jgi:hypothetical protein